MKINKEKAKARNIEEIKTIKQAILRLEKLTDYFEHHNKNLTKEKDYKIMEIRDILECIEL